MYNNCVLCNSIVVTGTKFCPICGFTQDLTIPDSRSGPCRCNSGKILVATTTDEGGRATNFCIDCITSSAASRMSALLIEANAHLPNQDIKDKILSLASNNGKYNFSEKEKKDALAVTVGIIHAVNERKRVSLPKEE